MAAATVAAAAAGTVSATKLSLIPLLQSCSLRLPATAADADAIGRRRRRRYPSLVLLSCLPSPSPSLPPETPLPRSAAVGAPKLYVSGLSFRTTEESFRKAFEKFGQLREVNLVMDKIVNRPRGFGFLRYATEEETKNAIEGMHGKFLDGRVIFVEVAKPRSEMRHGSKAR